MTASARVIPFVRAPSPADPSLPPRLSRVPAFEERLARALERYLPFIWRVLRRMGLSRPDASRALGHVFGALAEVDVSRTAELSLLVGAAVRVASRRRRSGSRLRAPEPDPCDAETLPWDQAAGLRDSLLLIDGALAALQVSQRAVFVLIELEGMTRSQVAVALELPRSTISARLERARLEFGVAARRLLEESGPRVAGMTQLRTTPDSARRKPIGRKAAQSERSVAV